MAERDSVHVEIYDQTYHIRAGSNADAEQIRRAAGHVDSRMRAVAAQTRDVDSLRLAVLAALHVADEYQTLQARYQALVATVEKKSAELGRLLDRELKAG